MMSQDNKKKRLLDELVDGLGDDHSQCKMGISPRDLRKPELQAAR